MSRIVLDDHLLRDLLTDHGGASLRRMLRSRSAMTTNLYYLRLCRSLAGAAGGQLTGRLPERERQRLGSSLAALPDSIDVIPMRSLAYPMAVLAHRYGLSSLGAEAIAAASWLDAPLCVSTSDDGPRIRSAAASEHVEYLVLATS